MPDLDAPHVRPTTSSWPASAAPASSRSTRCSVRPRCAPGCESRPRPDRAVPEGRAGHLAPAARAPTSSDPSNRITPAARLLPGVRPAHRRRRRTSATRPRRATLAVVSTSPTPTGSMVRDPAVTGPDVRALLERLAGRAAAASPSTPWPRPRRCSATRRQPTSCSSAPPISPARCRFRPRRSRRRSSSTGSRWRPTSRRSAGAASPSPTRPASTPPCTRGARRAHGRRPRPRWCHRHRPRRDLI